VREYPGWPPFLLDLMPQGHARKKIAEYLKLDADAPSTEVHLLLRGASSPVGNIRVAQAHRDERARLQGVARKGLTREEIATRSPQFLEVADQLALIASGSSGLQGEWPKIALTRAADGFWYPDPIVADDDALEHVIVKLLRSNDGRDRLILECEAAYASIAKEFGVRVHGNTEYHDGVLIIPRFDRRRDNSGLIRLGQESFVSAIGVAEFGHLDSHENYLEMLRKFSSDPLADVTEYIMRDALNLAMGNSDNHGRNTALSKTADGKIRLSPLFDFAPMSLAPADMGRPTKWACMRSSSRDHAPNWAVVCAVAAAGVLSADDIVEGLLARLPQFEAMTSLAKKHGVPESVIQGTIRPRAKLILDGLRELKGSR
jgi:serine/threonine-protein kinase HipA